MKVVLIIGGIALLVPVFITSATTAGIVPAIEWLLFFFGCALICYGLDADNED